MWEGMVRRAVKVKIKRKQPKAVFITGWEYVNLRLGAGLVQSRIKDFGDPVSRFICGGVCVYMFETC